jgi:hypothetical protein
VGRASSAKKLAKVAEGAKTAKVRQQKGRVFPAAVAAVMVLGSLLVWYARDTAQAAASVEPTIGQHWHVAFGIYGCDKWLAHIQENNEAGIHTHADGVIHVHPSGGKGAGKRAKLGTWFDLVDLKISDAGQNKTRIELPEGLGTFTDGDDCGGKPGKWQALVWEKASDTGDPQKFIADIGDVRFRTDGMAISLVFANEDADLKSLKPQTAAQLAELGAVDSGGVTPSTTVAGDTSATTVAGSASSSDAPTTTAASTSSSSP